MANYDAARAWRNVSPPTGVPCAPRAPSDRAEGRRRGESWVGVPESRTDPETASRSQQVAPPDSRLCNHERSRVSSVVGSSQKNKVDQRHWCTRCCHRGCGQAAMANLTPHDARPPDTAAVLSVTLRRRRRGEPRVDDAVSTTRKSEPGMIRNPTCAAPDSRVESGTRSQVSANVAIRNSGGSRGTADRSGRSHAAR